MRAYLLSRLRLQRRAFVSTGLAISLAVAFVVVVLGATATLEQYAADGAAPRQRVASVVAVPDVTSPQVHQPTDAEVAAVRRLPGVQSVTVVRSLGLGLQWPDAAASTVVESLPAPGLAWYSVTSGRAPSAPGEVLVDRRTADNIGLRVGDRLPVVRPEGSPLPAALVVSGLFTANGVQPFDRTVLAAERDLATWGRSDGEQAAFVGRLDVLARPGTDVQALVAAVRATVPGQDVRTGPEAVEAAVAGVTQGVDVLGRVGLAFTAVSLLVALIVIGNTFAILLAQRTRETALLRCVGATRKQLRRAGVQEAAALGLVASAVGVGLGVGVLVLAAVVLPHVADVLTGLRPVLGPVTLVLPVVVGVVVTVVASVLPTRRAARVAPLAAMRPQTAVRSRRTSRLRLAAAAVCGLPAAGLVAVAPVLGSQLGVPAGVAGGSLLVLAVVLAAPVVVPLTTRVVGAPLVLAGPVGRIAVGNTRRNPARSAATSIAVFVGVALISVLSVGASTIVRAVEADIDRTAPLDVAIATGGEYSDTPAAGLGAGAVPAVAKVPGIVAAAGLRGVAATVTAGTTRPAGASPDQVSGVLGGDPAALAETFRGDLPLDDRTLLVPDTAYLPLVPGALRTGDTVTLTAGKRSVRLTVTVVPHLTDLVVSPANLDRLGAGPGVVSLWARAADGADPVTVSDAVTKALASGGRPGVTTTTDRMVSSFDLGGLAQRAQILGAMRIMLLAATGLLGVALVISLVGIANTLSLSVLERSRESAVSRAIGMTRRQLRAGLALEALLLGGVGCVLGLAVGGTLGWVGALTLLDGVTEVAGPVVPLGRVAALVAVALVAALLASVLPGRRAALVSPTRALAEA